MSPLLYKCYVLFVKYYNIIFHPWCQIRIINILGSNVCQFQTSSTPINLCILNLSPLVIKFIPLEMCLVYLVFLPFFAIHIADLLSKTIRGSSSVTMAGLLFNNSWSNILKCAEAIPAVHAALYPISAIDWATGPGTCVPWSIGPP